MVRLDRKDRGAAPLRLSEAYPERSAEPSPGFAPGYKGTLTVLTGRLEGCAHLGRSLHVPTVPAVTGCPTHISPGLALLEA